MGKRQTKIIAISSFSCHGNAGLKPMMTVLANSVIPVPSILLTATTNLSGFIKTENDFKTLLKGSLELCKTLDYDVILFCGYFYKAWQIDFTIDMVHQFKEMIRMVLVDPILGDDNRIYVENEILESMPKLVSIATIAFPNTTEVKYLSSGNEEFQLNLNELVRLYPNVIWVVKSMIMKKGRIGIRIQNKNSFLQYDHQMINAKFGGSGDLFVSYFIDNYIIKKNNIFKSVKKAARKTAKSIKISMIEGSNELIAHL